MTWRTAQRQGLVFITVNDGSGSAVNCRRDIRELQDFLPAGGPAMPGFIRDRTSTVCITADSVLILSF